MVNATEAGQARGEAVSLSPFHVGEQRIQTMTGVRDMSEQLGRAWHTRTIRPNAAKFLEDHQLLYTASKNKDGLLWASVLAGPKGFVHSPNPTTLVASPLTRLPADPAELNEGGHIGMLAIDLSTRQRERINGIVTTNQQGRLEVAVEQDFAGCPKYIQARPIQLDEEQLKDWHPSLEGKVTEGAGQLHDEQKQLVERADTLFLASCYDGALEAGNGVVGCDVSHRGGLPGFVQITEQGTLQFADYIGNMTFTTLGNIVADSRTAIHILDFHTGDSLQLSCHCEILWEERQLPGAERTLEFVVQKWVHVRNALPFRPPGKVKWSPYNPAATNKYSAEFQKDRIEQLIKDYLSADTTAKMLRCLAARAEAPGVMSFDFEARKMGNTDEGNVFANPGQFASFDFPDISPGKVLNRTWTISSPQHQIAEDGIFTITVKKAGLVSAWLFEKMLPGKTICFRGVDGNFTLRRLAGGVPPAGLLLIAGGIGITPMRTIFHECIDRGHPVTLLHSIRNPEEAIFHDEFREAAQTGKGVHFAVTVTDTTYGLQISNKPDIDRSPDEVQRLSGRMTADMIEKVCKNVKERAVFQCGPTVMMQTVSQELERMGFPMDRLHQEEFTF